MKIRMAKKEDAEGIAHVKVTTWRQTYKNIIKDDYLEELDEASIQKSYAKWIEWHQSTIMVLEDKEKIVGYASGGEARTEDYQGYGEVYALYVLPQYQKRGRGESLMYYMIRSLMQKGYDDLVIWCLSGNPNQGFYKRLGAQPDRVATLTIGGEQYLERAFVWQDVGKALKPMHEQNECKQP